MTRLYTLTEAAEEIGVHKSSVSRQVAKLGIGTKIGTAIALTKAEVTRLKRVMPGKPGNPNATPGNRFFGGQPPQEKGKKAARKRAKKTS